VVGLAGAVGLEMGVVGLSRGVVGAVEMVCPGC
jgi:hypothetical protein